MQIILIMGIFGLFYSIVAGMTATLAKSAMQLEARKNSQVNEMFEDIEFAINKILLSEVDQLSDFGVIDANNPNQDFTFIASETNWVADQLVTDPWQLPYNIISYTKCGGEVLHANGGVGNNAQTVTAPIWAVALISGGPNRTIETADPGVGCLAGQGYNGLQILVAGGDDIVHTFTTYQAAVNMWNQIRSIHESVASMVADNYKQQLEQFAPTIRNFYDGVLANPQVGVWDFTMANSQMNWWRYGIAGNPIPGGFPHAGLLPAVTAAGRPTMAVNFAQVGATSDVAKIAAIALAAGGFDGLNIALNGVTRPDQIVLTTTAAGFTPARWIINYNTFLDGETLIVGGP